MRKYAREVAFSLIFQYFFHDVKDELELQLFESEQLSEEDIVYIKNTYNGVVDNMTELKNTIALYAKGFSIDRIYKIDLAILSLACFELQFTDTPSAVVINEALELSKKFSTEKSAPFVNGILATVNNNLKK